MWVIFLVSLVHGDVYMHRPRGSNDRNCERNVNRNNGNLLFDSQNNAKGGYACPRAVAASNDNAPPNGLTPRMKFEEGSQLEVEWTAQHGCGLQKETAGTEKTAQEALMKENSNVHCEIVVQMGCSGTLDPMMEYSGNAASQPNGNGVASFNAASTPNGLIAVPREGIPNSNGDAATDRIGTNDPGTAKLVAGQNEAATLRSGVHETPEYYNACNRVQRNRGLFTADQNVNRRSAIGTRQNPNGGRRGLECPEERDYYPYWGPSPFLDVAYLVDDTNRCGDTNSRLPCGGSGDACTASVPIDQGDWVGNVQGFTQGGAKNVMGACVTEATGKIPKASTGLTGDARRLYNRREWPNNAADCKTLVDIQANQNTKLKWTTYMFTPSIAGATANAAAFETAASNGPECNTLDYSRSNHLGNTGVGDTASRYTMTIPKVNPAGASITTGNIANLDKAVCANCRTSEGEPCFLRIRYNMSSSDYNRSLDSASNGDQSPIQQDPLVEIAVGNAKVPVQLALNTNQVARTFQDRSYVFYVVPRPTNRGAEQVINVGVRGKRGNIVQTYPAVEYDFIPNNIMIDDPANQVLAFQWSGSDYNPRRGCNDGEGGPYSGDNNVIERLKANPNLQGSNQNSRNDRTTLLAMNAGAKKNYPFVDDANVAKLYDAADGGLLVDQAQALRFMDAKAKEQLGKLDLNCLTTTQINNINNENRRENHPRNCAEGNALSPYFSTEYVDFTTPERRTPAQYVMYSARNNNFSNRDTKLKVYVQATGFPKPDLPQELFVEPVTIKNQMFNEGLQYDPVIGSYDTEAMVEAKLEQDVIGFDPVENNAFGEGALEGCEQEMLMFSGASSEYPHFQLMVFLFFSAIYELFISY